MTRSRRSAGASRGGGLSKPPATVAPQADGAPPEGALGGKIAEDGSVPDLREPRRPVSLSVGALRRDEGLALLVVEATGHSAPPLEGLLRDLGPEVVVALSPAQVEREVRGRTFPVILLELGSEGLETAFRIRREERSRHTPILFLTTLDAEEIERLNPFPLDPVDFLFYPIIPEILRSKIRMYIDLALQAEQFREQSERIRRIEQKQHDLELVEMKVEQIRFFSLSLDMLCVTNLRGRVKDANPAWQGFFGPLDPARPREIPWQRIHPDDLRSFLGNWKRLLSDGKIHPSETRCRGQAGEFRWLSWTAVAFPEEDLCYIGARDVTARVLAEEELRIRRQQIQLLLDSTAEGILGLDRQGRITFCNRSSVALLGCSRSEELTGRDLASVLNGRRAPGSGGRAASARSILEACAAGKSLHCEEEALVRVDGSRFPAEVWVHPIRTGEANSGSVVTIVDITERMKVEEARRHLSALVRSSEDAIVGMTLDGTVISWNPAAEVLWGYPSEGMVGQPIDLLFLPERKKDWTELLGRLREGSPVRTVEMTHRRIDGRFLSTSVSLSTIEDDRGRPVGISLIARDITEQMKADRVREAQYEVARILGEVPTVRQAAPRVLEILCRNLGWETGVCWLRTKEPGVPPDLVSWPADVPLGGSEVEPPWDVSSTGHPLWIENVSALRGGAWADWTIGRGHRSALLVPLRRGDGTSGMIGLFDPGARAPDESILRLMAALGCQMTLCLEREHAEGETRSLNTSLEMRVEHRTLQLQEAIAELDAFAYTVSHDLRAPLRAMHGFSQALIEDYSKTLDPTGREYARRIADATQRMDTLILDLLTYSRLGREELPLEPVALSNLLDELLAGFRVDLLDQNADIDVAPVLPSVLAHSVTLRQVVTNLLTNALKFVREGTTPRIRIRAERLGAWGRIWFEDNGIGIDPAHHERIFRVFERLNKIECYPGTGIGLAIVRRGMEKMGGRVGVVSSLGEGSRFWIELPIIEDDHESDGFHAPAGRG